MRFLPLVPSRLDPGPWLDFRNVELLWNGPDTGPWARAVRGGLAVHGVHLPAEVETEDLVRVALEILGAGLETDFIVVPAQPPGSRWGVAKFLGGLEGLLEATAGRGVKVALRPAAGATPRLLELLREVKGDALGFCWDADLGEDVEPIADRLHCAVGGQDTDPRSLQRWGYRWNLAIPAADPATIGPVLDRLRQTFPPVLFPAEMPATALGRPVLADPEVSLGRIWDRGER
jgi:hypothetical protein